MTHGQNNIRRAARGARTGAYASRHQPGAERLGLVQRPGPGAPQQQAAQPAVPAPVRARPMAPTQQEQIVLWIGDIGVSPHWVVTPNGTAPLATSQWIVRDGTHVEEKMPAYAIVLAIIFFLACLLGLLFLLIKERKVVGFVEVTVRSGDVYHVTQIPAKHAAEIDGVRRQVHQAQSMAYALGQQ
jgi:hypothetical protein